MRLAEGDFFLAKNCYTEAENIQSLFLLSQTVGYEEGLRDVGERATKVWIICENFRDIF